MSVKILPLGQILKPISRETELFLTDTRYHQLEGNKRETSLASHVTSGRSSEDK
jgi:hypothetical protein